MSRVYKELLQMTKKNIQLLIDSQIGTHKKKCPDGPLTSEKVNLFSDKINEH